MRITTTIPARTSPPRPSVGQFTTCHGMPARILKVYPAGTIDVQQIATGNCFRITGLSFR